MERLFSSDSARLALALLLACTAAGCHAAPAVTPPVTPAPRAQNPSPMVETVRRHERVRAADAPPGIAFQLTSVLPRPVDVFIPERPYTDSAAPARRTLLIHVFGAAYVPTHAVATARDPYVLAVINLGGGSSVYERALSDSAAWNALLERVRAEVAVRAPRVRIGRVVVSAFSAGYGGIRALLSNERSAAAISGVLLLDGLHTGYVPERTVLAEGGALDTLKLLPFLRYARRAAAGEVALVITHSEIFPGTFASTTETADWIIQSLGLARTPVLAWGPGGMQQLSEVRRGGLVILGFAGNTGPDHVDHLHGIGGFLPLLNALQSPASTP